MKSFDFKFFDFLKIPKRTPAKVAKERLQIIVSHESSRRSKDFIKDLQRELLEVISKYVNIDHEQIKVQLEQHGGQSVLELNVTLQEKNKTAEVEST
ncbi:MAG TPA: cell division topological specificity factor MinE [Gammaproteobacteria bacterium]|nr:cell division topological specificity factor MinE [Gammaproteobacteria bacterium]